MNETITTVKLLLDSADSAPVSPEPVNPAPEEPTSNDEATVLVPDTGDFRKTTNDSMPSSGISLVLFVACVAMVIIQIARLFCKKKNKAFSINDDKATKKTIINCSIIMACCILGGLSVKNFKELANAANGEQTIALTSSGTVNIHARVGGFSYACDSLNIATKTPAGYKIYARVLPNDSLGFFDDQGGAFSWTSNGKLMENNVGYTFRSNQTSADDGRWKSLSETWKAIKEYTGATDANDFKTEVCYGVNFGKNNNGASEYSMKVRYYAAAKSVDYVLEYDANGGSSAPAQQKYENTIESSHTFTITSDIPTRDNYIFLGWSTTPNGDAQYGGGDSFTTDKILNKLYAVWVEDSPVVEYSFPREGKYIFINNKEELWSNNYFADSDKGNKLLYSAIKVKDEDASIEDEDERYSDAYPGAIDAGVPTEIYFEHYIPWWKMRNVANNVAADYDSVEKRYKNDDDKKMHYAIRLYNPSSSKATVSFGNCGSSVLHSGDNQQQYRQTSERYYNGEGCSLKGTEIAIGPRQSIVIMPTWTGEGNEVWEKWDLTYYSGSDTETINAETSIDDGFDGMISLTSSKFLFISAFVFADYSKTYEAVYEGNFWDGDGEGGKPDSSVSGYFNKAPFTEQSSVYYITDDTESGTLKTRYRGVDEEIHSNDDNVWYTNNKTSKAGSLLKGDYATLNVPINLGDERGMHYMTMGAYYNGFKDERRSNKAFNWGNWGVHYEDKITIKNLSSTSKTVVFVISSGFKAYMVAYYNGETYPLSYSLEDDKYVDNEIWEVEIPAGEERTMTTSSTLCGMSNSGIKRRVILK